MRLVYRPLGEEDAALVQELEGIVFPGDLWSLVQIEEELSSPFSYYLGAFTERGALAGYGGIKGRWEGDLMSLGVLPQFQRQGVGRELLLRLVGEARKREWVQLYLEVRVSNEAATRLYLEEGFTVLGRIPGYYRTPREDALRLGLILDNAQFS